MIFEAFFRMYIFNSLRDSTLSACVCEILFYTLLCISQLTKEHIIIRIRNCLFPVVKSQNISQSLDKMDQIGTGLIQLLFGHIWRWHPHKIMRQSSLMMKPYMLVRSLFVMRQRPKTYQGTYLRKYRKQRRKRQKYIFQRQIFTRRSSQGKN